MMLECIKEALNMLERLKEIVKDSRKIAFFGGAGVSTESNIPDFRSEEGLYKAKKAYGKSPEEILSHSFFMNNTEMFYDYYKKNLIYKDARPNEAHKALAKLEHRGKLSAIVTQNIDGLHQLAGSKKVYELHGSVLKNTCMQCMKKFNLQYILDEDNCKVKVPICDSCGGVVKPDVVLYGESLEESQIIGAVEAISNADTLIVGGTSLVVYPAAGLIEYFRGENLVLINKTSTQYDKRANLVINDSIGTIFKEVEEVI